MEQNAIVLKDFHAGRCLHPYPKKGESFPRGKFAVVTVIEGTYLLPRALIERAQSIGADRLYKGGQALLANVTHDIDALGKNGLDATWQGNYHDGNERMKQLAESQKGIASQNSAVRALSLGNADHAVSTARYILNLAGAAGLRPLFGITPSDFQSYDGRDRALVTIAAKLQVPGVRERLRPLGLTDDMVTEVQNLRQQLQADANQRLMDKASKETLVLDAVKGMLLGDMLLVSKISHAALPPERARLYQIGRLMPYSGRKRRVKPGPAVDQPGTAPAPGTAHGGHHAHGTPHGGAAAPPVQPTQGQGATGAPPIGVVTTVTPPPGPTLSVPGTGTGAAAGQGTGAQVAGSQIGTGQTAVTATPPPAGQVPTGVPAIGSIPAIGPAAGHAIPGLQPLVPGTVLSVLPAAGGPQLVAVVQPDGSVAWVPATSIPVEVAPPPHQQQPGHGHAHGHGHHPHHGTTAHAGTPPAGGTPALPASTPPAATPNHRGHNRG